MGKPRSPDPQETTFPVAWERPEDAEIPWTLGRIWLPGPVTPADVIAAQHCFEHGIAVAAQTYGLPIRGFVRRINTYFYYAIVPTEAPPDHSVADVSPFPRREGGEGVRSPQDSQEILRQAMVTLGEHWRTEWLPEIRRCLAAWETFDLPGASLAALLDHYESMLAGNRRLYEIDILTQVPARLAVSMFDDLYRDLFGHEAFFDAYALLQGFENKTVATGRALWRVSRRVLASPDLHRALIETAPAAVPAALQETVAGRTFWDDLQVYLQEYGQRSDTWAISEPSWIEDPAPVILALRQYLGQPNRDLDAELAARAAERERRLEAVRDRLRERPQAVQDEFALLLKAAQEATVIIEDGGFWIDFCSNHQLRRLLLELGRRLAAAGVLARTEDVFLLTSEELRETATHFPNLDARALATQRQAEMERFAQIEPPPLLGTALPSAEPADPLARSLVKVFGPPPRPGAGPDEVRGNPASPGVVRGRARLLRSAAEADRLRPGDILVGATASPAWTPLFVTAAGLVTETGGIAGHCAVIAREYGIPAVTGAVLAMTAIQDGQLIEVDGTAGVVRLLGRA